MNMLDKIDEAEMRVHSILSDLDWLEKNGFGDALKIVREKLEAPETEREAA